MTCFWRHRWSKWEIIQMQIRHPKADGALGEAAVQDWQERRCGRCGWYQRRRI